MKAKKIQAILVFIAVSCINFVVFYWWILPTIKPLFVNELIKEMSWNNLLILLATMVGYALASLEILSILFIFKKIKSIDDTSGIGYNLAIAFLLTYAIGISAGAVLGLLIFKISHQTSAFVFSLTFFVFFCGASGFLVGAFRGILNEFNLKIF